jgi:hypothetical protein
VESNGGKLLFRESDKMMTADITTQPSLSAGESEMLLQGNYLLVGN